MTIDSRTHYDSSHYILNDHKCAVSMTVIKGYRQRVTTDERPTEQG